MSERENLPVPFEREIHRPVAVGYERAERREGVRRMVADLAATAAYHAFDLWAR